MFRSSSSFDRLLERATSHLLLEPDWDAILSICDTIRSGDVAPKYAVAAIKKKFYSENPHVVLYALMLIESCVKNCGNLIHDEVCTKPFMEELRELVKHASDENVKQKILEILQTWGMAFRNQSKYRIVTDTLNLMKAEGWKFPPVREAEAMFEADIAPDWSDGDVCHRCRVQFGMMTRQHHCRGCGQVFCSKCSSKVCPIPRFGIEKEVRVCDPCFDKFGPKDGSDPSTPKKSSSKSSHSHGELPAEYLASHLAQQSQAPPSATGGKTEAEIKEEEDLQLALALSQSEAEEKEKLKLKSTSQILAAARPNNSPKDDKPIDAQEEELAPELMRYLNRNYWEQQQKEMATSQQQPTKSESKNPPITSSDPGHVNKSALKKSSKYQEEVDENGDNTLPTYSAVMSSAAKSAPSAAVAPIIAGRPTDDELDEFVTTLKTQVEIFVNRMKSNSSRGRPIANDSSVQTLFMNTMAMHSKLLRYIQEQEDCRVYFEGLQDKITQVKDARAALDALREEEKERKRREAEEAERLRQIQMREKLEVMRQKKQEYLQYQRQVALQRMQEQEREMLFRQEQAKQHYLMQQQQAAAALAVSQQQQQQQQQPMFHPAMYGPMSSGAPMSMMAGPPYYMPPGQFQPMSPGPGQPPASVSSPGPGMVHGPMSMGMPTSSDISQGPPHMSMPGPPVTSGYMQGLPTYQSLPQSPHLQHQQQQPTSLMAQPHLQQQQVIHGQQQQQQPVMMGQPVPPPQPQPQQQVPQPTQQQQQQQQQQYDNQELISFD